MKALVGVDGSQNSFAAVALVSQLLAPEKDRLLLYYSPPHIFVSSGESPDILTRARQALATAVFDEAQAHVAEAMRGQTTTLVGEDAPRHGLLATAEREQADLIAVGARGSGPIERRLLGSVASSAAHSAKVPVLVVRPRQNPQAPLRVLLATDGSDISEHAKHILELLTWPPESEGWVMTVVESLLAVEIPRWLQQRVRDAGSEAMARGSASQQEQARAAKREELLALRARLPGPFQKHEPLVCEGHPADQILQAAAEQSADVIVVGARGRGTLARLLLGSTSESVMKYASCSVLIVRHPDQH